MWRFDDRYDLQMLVQSARSVARGPVARLVAEGARNSHEWTEAKAGLLQAFDEAGLTAMFPDPEHGGFMEGPKNFMDASPLYGNPSLPCLIWAGVLVVSGLVTLRGILRLPYAEA